MNIKIEETGTFSNLKLIIEEFDKDEKLNGIMIYSCEENELNIDEFNAMLSNCQTQVFGGLFPNVLANGKKYKKGSIVVGFTGLVHTQIFKNIHESIEDIQDSLEEFCETSVKDKTLLINIDGLSEGVEGFKDELFFTLGLSKNFIGGGSGSLSFKRKPCVITNKGLLQDVAVLAGVNCQSGIGVAHGWEEISEPLKVTESEGNKIISINWEPAFEVYKNQIQRLSGLSITLDNFFEIAKAYPFGISKMGTEMVVRDPIGIIDDSSILCVGAVPCKSAVYLLNGNAESLIHGTKQALTLAEDAFLKQVKADNEKDKIVLFIDCISRALFLEDRYEEELSVVNRKNVIGALTLGEIANTGKAYLELYNKTSVIGILEE